MSNKTKEFERKFANYIGSRYALMLNSGSSANLLAMFAMINPQKKDWGVGQIQSVIKNKVTINFENAGKKVINAENIKLEKFKNNESRG